jgi:DNA-binding MarR family transcriptional regulator
MEFEQASHVMEEAPAVLAANRAVAPSTIKRSHKRDIQSLLWALRPLANLRGPIPLSFVTTFLMVALDEGKGVNAYARAVGIHRSAMSRYLRSISDRACNGSPGLGLVKVEPHPAHSSRCQVFLTDKGRAVAKSIFQRKLRTDDGEH